MKAAEEEETIGSVTGSNNLSWSSTPVLTKKVSTRRSSRLSSNPACNTRSKKK
jgi:hypothetical protein